MTHGVEIISDANNLYNAFQCAKSGSSWKESVQKYEEYILPNIFELQDELRNGTYQQKDFYKFFITERGKPRIIKSMHISDRVVQRSLCDNILVPTLSKYLIYDNGASLKDKGVDFARQRIETHLHRYYKKYGSDGYILLIDFSKFFDNIPHKQLLDMFRDKIHDNGIMDLIEQMINSFKIDVSYMSDDEYANCMNVLFNSVEYAQIPQEKLTGEKFMYKSVGIGSQISQIAGIFYPTQIDNYCKIVQGLKFYGRYMDDIYIIHQDKEYLKQLIKDVTQIATSLGLFINTNKTQIVKLSHEFTWLKVKYRLTDTGGIEKRLSSDTITRERRKLKKFYDKINTGLMCYEDVVQSYQSWRGNVSKYKSTRSLEKTDKLFNELYVEPFIKGGYKA